MNTSAPTNQETQATWEYHDHTKHSYQSVRANRHYLDWSNMPLPFKIYTGLSPIPLRRDWQDPEMPALPAISQIDVGVDRERIPNLKDIAQLLYFSAGVIRRKVYTGGEILFRAASCTGALYEIELYLVCAHLPDLAAGVYHFNPRDFALRLMRHGDYRPVLARASAGQPSIVQAPLVIVCTGTYWRNAWKYQARTYRHFGWDNGTILANLLAMSAALQLPARLVLGFVDDPVNNVLDLDTQREVPLCLVSVGKTPQRLPLSAPPVEPLRFKTEPYSEYEVDYPEMRAMHAATGLMTEEEVAHWREQRVSSSRPAPAGPTFKFDPHREGKIYRDTLAQVVQHRGSSRRFQKKPISFRELSSMLYCSAQGIPADYVSSGALLNDWYLIVHAVDGLPPGAYVLHRDRWELELLKEGNFRSQAGYLGLEQELPADASADVFFLADLQSILQCYGNRGYRAVQLEAGILGGKLYLAAYAQRLGATGLTFYDDDVVEFFSPDAKGKSAIFLMAMGHGAKRSLLG